MADPLVIEWHSRDLGSEITEREVSAVAEWLSTNKRYHVMRDHPTHQEIIQVCCFGMKVPKDDEQTLSTNLLLQGKLLVYNILCYFFVSSLHQIFKKFKALINI